jgi:hypothetical protein
VILKSLFGGRSAPTTAQLPQVNTFVDVIAGGRPARSVSVESVGAKGIVTAESLGSPGEAVTMVYTTSNGRFRVQTRIVAVTATTTQFETPRKIEAVAALEGAQKRQNVRMDTLVSGHWRLAPNGKGVGEFARGTIKDISRGGCSLITERALKHGSTVEVRMSLRSDGQPTTVVGEVVRYQEIRSSGRHSHGLRFHGLRPDEDQAIIDFINRKQAELRSRGLA